jgi:hypothetical protein
VFIVIGNEAKNKKIKYCKVRKRNVEQTLSFKKDIIFIKKKSFALA